MIKAKFNSQKNLITGFTLSGHADSGEYGHDIVCAAVSVLSISTVNGLSQVAGIKPMVDQDEKNGGYLAVTIKDIEECVEILADIISKAINISLGVDFE